MWHKVNWSNRGDGTVPLYSANLYDPITGLDIRHGTTVKLYSKVEHLFLVQDPEILKHQSPFLLLIIVSLIRVELPLHPTQIVSLVQEP